MERDPGFAGAQAGYIAAAVLEFEEEDQAMFEIGKRYTIRMWEDGEEGDGLADYENCEAVEISLPLVKFRQSTNEDVIVNTASLAFVQATLETDEEAEAEE